MKRHLLVLGSLLVAVALAGAWWATREDDPEFDAELNVVYKLRVSNPSGHAVRDARVLAYAPIAESGYQHALRLRVTSPYEEFVDSHGNRVLEIKLGLLPPYGQTEIAVEATVASASTPNAGQPPDEGSWLGKAPWLALGHPELNSLTATIRHTERRNQPASIEELVASRLKPAEYDAIPRGAAWALEHGKGDCSEFAAVAAGLARSAGLPARLVDGWRVTDGGMLESAAFHTWAEVWDGSKWQTVDAHAQATGGHSGRYVAFRYQPDDPKELASGFSRFRAEGPVSVEML